MRELNFILKITDSFKGRDKFTADSFWLYLSFFVFSLCGLAINLLLALRLDFAALGIFHQVYAIYTIFSQFGVLAINDSAQQSVAFNISNRKPIYRIKVSAVIASAITGTVFALILILSAAEIGIVIDSPNVGLGLQYAAPGVAFFTLNKVMLGILNGERRIKTYSIFQIFRSLLILIFIVSMVIMSLPITFVGLAFTFSEFIILFPLLYLNLYNSRSRFSKAQFLTEIRNHFRFGIKAFPNAFLAATYLKVDIIMLSVFMDDIKVGIYGFAALFFEGVYQIPALIRTNVNPVLVGLLNKPFKAFAEFRKEVMLASFFSTSAVLFLVNLLFPLLIYFYDAQLIFQSKEVLLILSLGLVLYSIVLPFDFSFVQVGRPEIQSLIITLNLLVAVILNLALIPVWGIYGAATATTVTLLIAGVNQLIFLNIFKPFGKRE